MEVGDHLTYVQTSGKRQLGPYNVAAATWLLILFKLPGWYSLFNLTTFEQMPAVTCMTPLLGRHLGRSIKQMCENLQILFCSNSILFYCSLSFIGILVENVILIILYYIPHWRTQWIQDTISWIPSEAVGPVEEYKQIHIFAHIVKSSRVLSIVCQV